jgi:cytoskeleton protein RodZ
MNDVDEIAHTAALIEHAEEESQTAGALLRQAREAAGLHVAALAVSMKVSVKKLEALEADSLHLLLDAVYVRALASSVCRALKIDAVPILELLPQNHAPRLNAGEVGINAPFHPPGQNPGLFVPSYFAKPGFYIVLALLAGVAALLLFPEIQSTETLSKTEQVSPPVTVSPLKVDSHNAGVEVITPPPVVATPAPAHVVVAQATVSNVLPTPVTEPSAVKSQVPLAKAENTTAVDRSLPVSANPVNGILHFKAKEESWVEVVDGKGVVQLRRTLASGDSVGASGTLPLTVVVGRAEAVEVNVRGKAFALTGLTKDGVARFEVK